MKRPLPISQPTPLSEDSRPWAGLVASLTEEHSYICEVEGDLPAIEGRLYRLGPGLYERGGGRKRMVLDGDGMIQEFHFEGSQVRYRNRYIRTKKFVEEERAGRFIYPTLSTHSAGSWRENLGIVLPHQANITPLAMGSKLLAFDESQKPYELSTEDLSTHGETDLDELQPELRYWAHWKLDSKARQTHFLSIKQGPKMKAHVVSTDTDLRVVARREFTLPRSSYFHDWFITERYFGFVLHPAMVTLGSLLRVGLAIDTFSEVLKWQPEKGNLIFLVDRKTGQELQFEAPACWMWHSVAAWDQGDEVLVDFIGSENGGGLGDPNSPFYLIMQNKDCTAPPPSSFLRRYRIEPTAGRIRYETLDSSANFELPTVSAAQRGVGYDRSHFTLAVPGELFARGLGEWENKSEALHRYVSPGQEFFGEPLALASMEQDSDWISSLVYCGDKKRSYLALFRKGHLADGPQVKIWLRHHSPLGFHGHWLPEKDHS